MLSTYEKSRKTFTLSLGILPKIRKCVPLFLKIFYSHQVYFQKNWKRSRFFNIFPEKVVQRVYCQNFEERSGFAELFQKNFLTTGILPKNPKVFSLFRNFFQKSAQRVYFQNFWKRSGFSELFSKKISPLLPGLFPKRHPVVLLLFEKIWKSQPSPLIIAKSTPKRYTLF